MGFSFCGGQYLTVSIQMIFVVDASCSMALKSHTKCKRCSMIGILALFPDNQYGTLGEKKKNMQIAIRDVIYAKKKL